MKTWVLWYLSIILVCFFAEMILENTKFSEIGNKCIGIILTVSVVFCTVNIIKSNKEITLDIENLFNFDSNYVEKINTYKINQIKKEIEDELQSKGVNNVSVYFSTTFNDENMVIEKIHLDFSNSEYSLSVENIDYIKESVQRVFMIDSNCIIVYE